MVVGAKGRLTAMQMVAGAVLLSMTLVILYMYQVIDNMHREQQAMRLQIAELAGTGYSSSVGTAVPQSQPDFLPSRLAQEPGSASSGKWSALRERGVEPHARAVGPEDHRGHTTPDPRKLMGIFTTGQTAGVGCYELANLASATHDVSSATGCNGNACPDCFVTPAVLGQDVALEIQSCSSAKWIRGAPRNGVWMYTFINSHATRSLSVTDNSAGSPTVYNVPASSYIQAFCASVLGTANRLYYPSSQLPTLKVDNGILLQSGNFDASTSSGNFLTTTGSILLGGDTVVSGAKSFATGTGAVSLNGATTVKDNTAFTVGSSGSGGQTTLYGNVVIGGSTVGHSVFLSLYGDFSQNDDGLTSKTFSTATGGIYINGHTAIAANKNLVMTTGTGEFHTGTGVVSLNGDTTVTGVRKFATGQGTVSLNGETTVAARMSFTVGSSGDGGTTTLYGNLNIGGTSNGHSVQTTMYGSFLQYDDGTTPSTFATGTGAISLNGDTGIAINKNLHMADTGSGTFQTGTGIVTLNGDTIITSNKQFRSGTGQVSLNGNVQIGDGVTLSVGSAGNGGDTQMFGNVYIGGSTAGTSTLLDVYGNVRFLDDVSGTQKTFSTGTGMVELNGDVAVGKDRYLHMETTGTGTFRTGTGPISLNGDTTVTGVSTFTITTYTNELVCTHASGDVGDTFCKASR